MSTTQQPEALAADHSEQNLEMVARWYMIDKDGMATLCTDREDAEKEAKDANMAWPHTAPHRAVQLVEVASLAASAGSEPVAHLWQHSETGRTRIVMPDMIVDADASWQVVGPLYLGAAPPTAQAEGWRPIETAPKDGTAILLGSRGGSWIGKWLPVYVSGYRPENPWSSLMLNHDHMGEKWCKPTHWMPLPPPPTTSAGSGKGE